VASSSRSHGLHVIIEEITGFFVSVQSEEEFLGNECEVDCTVVHSEGASESVVKERPN
jgi:hypothetical protein